MYNRRRRKKKSEIENILEKIEKLNRVMQAIQGYIEQTHTHEI